LSVTVLPGEAVLLIIKNFDISKYKILRNNQIIGLLVHSTTFVTTGFPSDSELYNNSYFEIFLGASFEMSQKSLYF